MDLSDIGELDAGSWFSGRFAGERYPTLEETLDMMPGEMRLNVHVKALDENREILVPLVVEEIRRRGLTRTAFVTDGEATVVAAKSIAPELDICTNLPVSRCLAIGCRILQPSNRTTTAELVEEAHCHGMEVHPFYADEPAEMQRLIDCGVDGMLTNYPRRLLRLQSGIESGPESPDTEEAE